VKYTVSNYNAIRYNRSVFGNNIEEEQYFYHSDHLGSSAWITDAGGNVNQHLQYMPFGESFIDQRSEHDIRYKFTGKERDEETGLDYFGARYYSSDLSVWLSVDPLAFKYPGISPYAYVFNNPIMYIDKWGLEGEKPNPPKGAKQGDKYSYKNSGGGSSNYKYEEGVGWVGDGYSGDLGGVTITGKRPSWISKQTKAIKSWWKKSTNYMKVEGNVTWGAQLGAKVQVAGASVSLYGNMSSQTVLSLSANQTGTNESPWNFDAEYFGDDDYKTMTGGGSISCIGGYEFEEKYQLAWKGDDYGKMNTMTTSHTVNFLIASYTHTNNSSGAVVRDGKVAVGVKVAALVGLEIKVTFGTK
jgi:RHS repeat-associated protein